MHNRPPSRPDREVLPESEAQRVLARASELDAARESASAVGDLRAAAVEAGISARAFDAALAELQSDRQETLPDERDKPRRRSRTRTLTAALAIAIAVGALAVSRRQAPADDAAVPGAATVEEAIVLRCLSPAEAAELVRPLLPLPSNRIVYSPARAPHVLNIRATPEQLQNVKSALEKYENEGSATCAR